MLDGRNIQTWRPKDKLDHQKHGPFIIEKVVLPTANTHRPKSTTKSMTRNYSQ
jgi:hypothetical protein